MVTEIYFKSPAQLRIHTQNEVVIDAFLVSGCENQNQKVVIDELTRVFNQTEDLAEAQSLAQFSMVQQIQGVVFQYVVTPVEAFRKRVGAKIKDVREQRGMSGRELSFIANIDPSNLSKIEQGKYAVGMDVLFRILYVLDADLQIVKCEKQYSYARKMISFPKK